MTARRTAVRLPGAADQLLTDMDGVLLKSTILLFVVPLAPLAAACGQVPSLRPTRPSVAAPTRPQPTTLYRTTDGGQTWTATQAGGDLPVLLACRGASMRGADFTDAQHGWIFGTEAARAITEKSQWANTPISPFLVETRNGGRTWTRIAPVLREGRGATTK